MNLFHYCSNAAMVSIIAHKEIWASELALSNDELEGKWIREIFIEYCKEKNISAYQQAELLTHLDIVIDMARYAGFCMSEEGDLLSQWRAYSDNAAGISIGFNSEYFEKLGNLRRDRGDEFSAHLTRIEYDIAEQKKLIAEHADQIFKLIEEGALRRPTLIASDEEQQEWKKKFHRMGLHFLFFYFFLFKMKNPAFREEREWRVISHIFREDRAANFGQLAKMDFMPKLDRVVPFTRIKLEVLPETSLTEIILGQRNTTPERVVEALLYKYGWQNVAVKRSRASYR
jgi:hypothetical protein